MAVTVTYQEMSGSPQVGLDEAGFTATRQLLCAWTDAFTLITQLLGSVALNSSGQPVYLNPEAFPGIPSARVRKCAYEPYQGEQQGALNNGVDLSVATYRMAKVTVQYATPTFDPGDPGQPSTTEAFITETLTPSVSFLTISPQDAFWDSSQTVRLDFQTPLAVAIGQMEYIYQRRRLPDPLPSQLFSFVGKCNSATVTSTRLNYTFPAETLLYVGSELSRETVILPNGATSVKAWDVKQRYKYRQFSWNEFFKPGNSTPQKIYNSSGTQIKPVPTADFTQIRT